MKYVIPAVIVLIAGLFILTKTGGPRTSVRPAQQIASLSAQTNTEGPVTVDVTPKNVLAAEPWKFTIGLNTHSGSLDADLTQTVTLVDDKGNSYKPLQWDGAPPGGHHREGDLSFAPVTPAPKRISIVVKNIGGIAERTFNWTLGGE